jgi:hypothetical protein
MCFGSTDFLLDEEDLVRNRIAGAACAFAIAVLSVPGMLHAQGLTGQISGTVTDGTGGVLPGAVVTIRNVGTGLTRETVTGTDGAFLFPDLASAPSSGSSEQNASPRRRMHSVSGRFTF